MGCLVSAVHLLLVLHARLFPIGGHEVPVRVIYLRQLLAAAAATGLAVPCLLPVLLERIGLCARTHICSPLPASYCHSCCTSKRESLHARTHKVRVSWVFPPTDPL